MTKRFLALALVVTLSLTLFAACGGDKTTEDETSTNGKTIASQIVFGRQDDVVQLDPVMMENTNDIWTSSLLLEGLVKTSDDGIKIVPCLAKDWKISDDGLTYTFNLIPNLKFSDGTEVTGNDWIWSFERARDTAASQWTYAAANIVKIEAPDNNTLVLTMKENNASVLSNLSMFNMAVESKAHFDATNGYKDSGSYPIGVGPYVVKEWVTGDHLTIAKNTNYYDADQVKTKEIKFAVVPDDNSRVMMLQSGELDMIYPVPYSSMKQINSNTSLTAIGVPSTSNRYLVINEKSNKALADVRVRQALMYATDKQQIVDMILYGYGEPAVSYMPKTGLYWNDAIKPITYDVNKAKELLKEAGYADGFNIEFLVRAGNDVYDQIATIIKEQWAKIGVKVTLTTLETASLLEIQKSMKHEMCIGSWSDDVADPSQLSSYFWDYTVSQGFYTGYNNPTATKLFQDAQLQLDETKRADMYKELQKIWYDDVVAINLYNSQYTVGMSQKIKGFTQTPLGCYRFNDLVKYK